MKQKILQITKEYASRYGIDNLIGKEIILYENRLSHIEKHKYEFTSEDSYNQAILDIPFIISCPDFIHINGDRLSFVKRLNDNVLIAVQLQDKKEIKIKTLFPITSHKYERLKSETEKRIEEKGTSQ